MVFDQTEIDFGLIVLNQSAVKSVTLWNDGLRPGDFTISYDSSLPLQIAPTRGNLQAGASLQLQVRVEGAFMGPFRTDVKVESAGSSRTLELQAKIVSQNLEVLLPDASEVLDSIHFGTIYFGQERSFTAVLMNNGPHPSSFSTTIESKTEDEEMLVHFTEVSVEPAEGTLDPLSKIELVFKVRVTNIYEAHTLV
jgi:hypothetical protein